MSRSNGRGSRGVRSARLELQLNLSPPAPVGMEVDGHDDSDSSSPSSCVSSDGRSSSSGGSPGGKSPMVIGACTRCLMYCMVAKKDYPTCINCKQPCLVDLLHGGGGGNVEDDKKRGKRK
ncbi:protein GL2-INTERACTING REPRESSOR 1-like [Phragmites australis]|uniref:protein GL2-INTERACTING REPRESSOR 1-like n=1 Tax=Phragmites australis TaxID=29695 RepID=UPI002D77771F|nr:protein GL2-INTERACTING REPRESSOR 1-like [Phragmites australis]